MVHDGVPVLAGQDLRKTDESDGGGHEAAERRGEKSHGRKRKMKLVSRRRGEERRLIEGLSARREETEGTRRVVLSN